MTGLDGPKAVHQKIQKRADTACFVHQLIERERKAKKTAASNNLNDIAEYIKLDKPGEDHPQKLTHSRLLTKRQLSDMTWGVRELSKKLGNLRLRLKVKTIFILTKAHDEDLISYTREVTEWLLSKDRPTPFIMHVSGPSTSLILCLLEIATFKTRLSTIKYLTAKALFQRIHHTKAASSIGRTNSARRILIHSTSP